MKVFEAIKDLGRMNTAHIHGKKIYTDDVLDFPVAIMSWDYLIDGNPSLAEMKAKWPGIVMGGIDNERVTRVSTAFCRQNVREGLRLGGKSRFILANGCSTPTWLDLTRSRPCLEIPAFLAKPDLAPQAGMTKKCLLA